MKHLQADRWPIRRASAVAAVLWMVSASTLTGQSRPAPVELTVSGRVLVGSPLGRDHRTLWLLRPDGRVTQVDTRRIEATRQLPASAMNVSMEAVRLQLVQEFGASYQVSRTRHYLVVHPPGDHQQWAAPFEEMFQKFQAFFARRGMALQQPEFALVAVVLNTREEFDRFLSRHQAVDPHIMGYYSSTSNRIITYREVGKATASSSGFIPSRTIIHECAHQAAFNTGIHGRFAPTPKWLSEGLATLFEAPGVHNSLHFSRRADRIHEAHRAYLAKALAAGPPMGLLRELVEADRLFDRDPQLAYALAWGLTFFLVETQPLEYRRLLQVTGSKPAFENYSAAERLKDFQASIGALPEAIEPRVWRYLTDLEGN